MQKKGFIDVNYISAKIRFVYKSKRGTMYSFILKLQSLVHHEGSRYYMRPCCLFLSLSYNSRLVKRVRLESNWIVQNIFFFFLLDKDVTSCLVCKTLVNQIETTITDPTNEQAIADAVKGVCDLLFPNNMDNQNSCKAQIDNFIPVIVETIVNNFGNPDAICTALTLCP